MAHLSHGNDALLARVRRIGGQGGADCAEILQLVAAVRGAVNGLLDEIIADHLQAHVAHPDLSDAERARGAEDLLAVIRRYSK